VNQLSQVRRAEIEAQADARDDREDWQKFRDAVSYVIWCDDGVQAIADLAPTKVETEGFKRASDILESAYSDLACLLDDWGVDPDKLIRALTVLK